MSFSPSLNVIVLGTGIAAREQLAALYAVKAVGLRLPSGLPITLGIGVWAPAEHRLPLLDLVREYRLGLAGHDPAAMIEAHDIHVVVGCLEDVALQAETLELAVRSGKSALAVPPLSPDPESARRMAGLAEAIGVQTGIVIGSAEEAAKRFLEGMVRRERRVPTWREWIDEAYPDEVSPGDDPVADIRAALAALPREASAARAPLERALRALEREVQR